MTHFLYIMWYPRAELCRLNTGLCRTDNLWKTQSLHAMSLVNISLCEHIVLIYCVQQKAKAEITAMEMTYGSNPGSPTKRKVTATTPANPPPKIRKVRTLVRVSDSISCLFCASCFLAFTFNLMSTWEPPSLISTNVLRAKHNNDSIPCSLCPIRMCFLVSSRSSL